MFTGIVQAVGTVQSIQPAAGDWRVWVRTGELDLSDVALGDSIAVSGPCLTVVALEEGGFAADVSVETWERTAFADLAVGARVNLEKALLPTTRLGGHLVSGHVDGLAVLGERRPEARSERFVLEVPGALTRYVAEKGSICLDGVSLTVNGVSGSRFDVNLVPHTLAHTTLGDRRPGDRLNMEVDIIARYLERLLRGGEAGPEGGGLDADSLARAGFPGLGEGG
ncbi:riboflavin synthase [Thiohalorhabdus methylotrophus]|uniref:Riboflavin synthase n=1 Tax=Thiohalorhabdus methylotrophus TaxID=3242694 RepID=A0ABV4TX56_9GAMM